MAPRLLLGLIAALAALPACEPTCRQTCRKLVDRCGDELDLVGQTVKDCEDYCLAQQRLYEDTWDDPDLAAAWGDLKRCIADAECSELADGACYDEDLWIW